MTLLSWCGRERCRSEQFDLVIADIFFDEKPVGVDLISALHAENPGQSTRRLALLSSGWDIASALVLARVLPASIILRAKRTGILDSVLYEAETGVNPEKLWQDVIGTLDRAKRDYTRMVISRSGNNWSEAARRLGVHRATVMRTNMDTVEAKRDALWGTKRRKGE